VSVIQSKADLITASSVANFYAVGAYVNLALCSKLTSVHKIQLLFYYLKFSMHPCSYEQH